MMKKIICTLALLLAAGCNSGREVAFVRYCPHVYLNPAYSHVVVTAGKEIQYKAEVIGYEGYCRTNAKTKETYAVIAPIFEVSRVAAQSSPEVVFRYYTDTSGNPEKGIGREVREVSVNVPNVNEKIVYQGEYVEIRIPHNMPGFKIDLGMALSAAQLDYNRKHGLSAR